MKEKIRATVIFLVVLLLLFSFTLALIFHSAAAPGETLPAFPGAEGFGSLTPGGRYGKVIYVTTLKDTADINSPDYPGSLRWALEQTWPDDPYGLYDQRRIVLFKVGGTIRLEKDLTITHPYVTLAGQTAPGDGITIRGYQLTIATHDVIIRSLRVRVGDEGPPACCRDGINVSTTKSDSDVYNIIVDHSSVSWAIDENLSTWTSNSKPFKTHDITVQWSIISEALHNSIHVDEGATVTDPHSMGVILGQDGYNISIHHNLFANNWGRNPRISGMINSEIINNVVYGWEDAAVELSKDKNTTHILNNYFIRNSDLQGAEISLSDSMNPESQIYIDGNITEDIASSEGMISPRIDNDSGFLFSKDFVFVPSGINVFSVDIAYNDVLSFSGATKPTRDKVDQRVIENVIQGTGQIIDSQNQVGGWPLYQSGQPPVDTDNDGIPDRWELDHGLDIYSANDANNPNILAPSGYTWLEEYVNSLLYIPEQDIDEDKWSTRLNYLVVIFFVIVASAFIVNILRKQKNY